MISPENIDFYTDEVRQEVRAELRIQCRRSIESMPGIDHKSEIKREFMNFVYGEIHRDLKAVVRVIEQAMAVKDDVVRGQKMGDAIELCRRIMSEIE